MKNFQMLLDRHQTCRHLHKRVNQPRPEIMIITCCDSRIQLGHLFGADPGDLFVYRTAANIISLEDPQTVASIEVAVTLFAVNTIVIIGHSDCGGIRTFCEKHETGPYLKEWLENLKSPYNRLPQPVTHHDLEVENVREGYRRLMQVDWIAELVKSNKLFIHGLHLNVGDYNIEEVDLPTISL